MVIGTTMYRRRSSYTRQHHPRNANQVKEPRSEENHKKLLNTSLTINRMSSSSVMFTRPLHQLIVIQRTHRFAQVLLGHYQQLGVLGHCIRECTHQHINHFLLQTRRDPPLTRLHLNETDKLLQRILRLHRAL